MSQIDCAFYGVLGRDAERKTSKAGKPYLLLNVRVGDGDSAQWVSVLSFDDRALEVVDKLVKGAKVYIEGLLKLNEWTGQDGATRHGLSVMSFHTRLPQIGRNRQKPKTETVSVAAGGYVSPRSAPANRLPGEADFHNDEIPF